jgi:Uri superfamily endonuclease
MGRRSRPVATLERLEAILENRAIYELAALIPETDHTHGGRPRQYPTCFWLIFEALLSVYASARQVEAELSHPLVWDLSRRKIQAHFPTDPSQWLPARPMRRHHYLYARGRYLTDPTVFAALETLHREIASDQARELGLLDPDGPGSWTHPDLSRMLHADDKVITPLFKAKPGDTHLDKKTGELRPAQFEPDAALHFQGDGETAWGTKFVIVAARNDDVHGRIILDVAWVPKHGGEAKTAMECFTRLAPLVPGAQGVIYDTALRGVHHQTLLRDLGLLPVNRVAAAKADTKQPRRKDGRREEKSTRVETKIISLGDGSTRTVELYARGGAIGIGDLTERGDLRYTELRRVRTHRNRDKSGKYRWYNDYRLPENLGAGIVTVRLHGTPEDTARKLNRTENVRPIAATDPDFAELYPRRNDAESINRNLDDTLWLRRAHSIGHDRQLLNLLGYALMVNGLALHRYRRRHPTTLAA